MEGRFLSGNTRVPVGHAGEIKRNNTPASYFALWDTAKANASKSVARTKEGALCGFVYSISRQWRQSQYRRPTGDFVARA
eukprot:3519566-Rhodomonas_salina.1